MNGGLAFNAVLTLLLDDCFPITGLMLLDDGGAVAIAVPVVVPMAFAHGHAGADRPGADADLIRAIAGIASALTAATSRWPKAPRAGAHFASYRLRHSTLGCVVSMRPSFATK